MTDNGETVERISSEEMEAFNVLSGMLDRYTTASQAGLSFSGARDLYTELGYPNDLSFDDYASRYDREGLSGRIVDKPAEDTWRNGAVILEEGAEDTTFVEAWERLIDKLKIWRVLTNLDRITGLGEYGILLIGTLGGDPLDAPQQRLFSPDDILYLRPYTQKQAPINTVNIDPGDPRFGLPEVYEVDLGEVEGRSLATVKVHHSRVIHVAEKSLDDVYGRPRLKRSYNRLMDLDKVIGGSSEAVWRLVIKGLVVTGREGYKIDESAAAMEDEFLKYIHNLKRVITITGADVEELGTSEMPNPAGIFKTLVSLIAADINMPQNILIGSEQGIRASDVDATNWAGTISNRQTQFAEPVILRPFVDWCINYGALPYPVSSEGYEVKWNPLTEPTAVEVVGMGKTKAEIVSGVANSGALDFGLVTKEEVREWADLPPEPEGMSVDDFLDIEDESLEDEMAEELAF
jgi:hypothetical protein